MAGKDLTQKILLNYRDVFADVCNVLIFRGKFKISSEDLEDANPEIPFLNPGGKPHGVLRDIVKTYRPLNIRLAILGFENQTNVDSKMVFRDYRYRALDYYRQAETEDYIVPVITAVLFYDHTKRWSAKNNLKENLKMPEGLEEFVDDYKIHVIEVAWLSDEDRAMLRSDFKLVADALHELRTTHEIHGSKQRAKHARAVMAMLLALVKHDNYQEADLSWINEEEEPAMDDTWRKYEEKIYNKGKDDGYNLGKDDGYNLGKDDGYNLGKDDGYNLGKDDGYNLGKDDGYNLGKDDGYNLGKGDGYNLGKGDGEETARNSIALKMLQQNVDSQFIMQMTSISQDELTTLKQQLES